MGRWPHRRTGDSAAQAAHRLIEECECFLEGTYALALEREGQSPPGWAWLNLLAHGSPAVVQAVAEADTGDEGLVGAPWPVAASVLALELLTVAQRTGRSLGELQRTLILGLEARPALPDGADPTGDPARLVRAVRELLGLTWGISSR